MMKGIANIKLQPNAKRVASAAGVALVAALAAVTALAVMQVLLLRSGTQHIPPTHDPRPCTFRSTQADLRIYRLPFSDLSYAAILLHGEQSFPVVAQRESHYQVQTEYVWEGGWVERQSGRLEGNCANTPLDDQPLTKFPAACVFIGSSRTPVYADRWLVSELGWISANDPHLVIGRARDGGSGGYLVALDDAASGWIGEYWGVLRGRCDRLRDAGILSMPTANAAAVAYTPQGATATPTWFPTPELLLATLTPTDGPTPTPPELSPPPVPIPPGVVISVYDESASPYDPWRGMWLLERDGTFRPLALDVLARLRDLSPDGTRGFYVFQDDIWIINFVTGETFNATQTPDRLEYGAMWWPGNPDGFLCLTESPGPAVSTLNYVGFDGTYEILLDPYSGGGAPSPDGQTIALPWGNGGEGLSLYRRGVGIEPVDLSAFGLPQMLVVAVSWSPDGRQLGLMAYGDLDVDQRPEMAAIVLDLESQTHRVLHTFQVSGTNGSIIGQSAPTWSPSGEWMVINVRGLDEPLLWIADENGMWALDSLMPEGQHLALDPILSPDGQWLATSSDQGEIVLFHAGEWQPIIWEMPFKGAGIAGWLNLPSPLP